MAFDCLEIRVSLLAAMLSRFKAYTVNMRLLVTGGYGFIGSHFVESAVNKGHEVIVVDNLTYAGNLNNLGKVANSRFKFFKLDIANSKLLISTIAQFKSFDCVINFAAETHVDRSILNSEPFVKSNINGLVNILELVKNGVVKKMIQISTDEVYGTINEGSWDENAKLDPRSPYSASKASGDLLCLAYINTYKLNVTITRSANNYGPRQSLEKFIPNSISKVLSGMDIPVYGDGSNRREWLYVLDHIEAIMKIVEADAVQNSVYNIGGVEYSNIEVARLILKHFNSDQNKIKFTPDRLGHDFRYSVSNTKISSEFDWKPKHSFIESLKETIDWYVSNPNWMESCRLRLIQ